MSGMLHPVGPEPARTYWIRRGVLFAVVLLLALGVVLAVASLTKAAVATAPPPAIVPPASPSATASAGSTTPSSATSPSATSPSGSPGTASSTPSSSSTPSATATPTPSASGSTTAPRTRPTTTPSAKPSPTTTTTGTPDCRPAELSVTLKGDRTLSPGQNNRFSLSLINGGQQTCLISVTDRNFELKVYSGKDRIWSSRDCTKVLADFDKKLAAKAAVEWTMTWNGERSVKGKKCKNPPETPQAGNYWATAQLKGADPVQLRMIIS